MYSVGNVEIFKAHKITLTFINVHVIHIVFLSGLNSVLETWDAYNIPTNLACVNPAK